jgi:regulator of sigma E protease
LSERWIWFARIGVAAAALAGLVLAYIFLGISSLAFIGRLLLAIAALAVLIFVHEGGHFVAAKLSNLKVYEFMFGLPGPKLYVKRVGETDYGVTAIPFGGYVKFAGSDPFEELPPEDEKRAFSALPFWKKVLIIAAGPVTNVIFALILFYGVFQVAGIGVPTTTIAFVVPGTPAQAVGLKAKDRIVEAAGKQVRSWTSLVTEIRPRGGQRLALTVVRGNQRLQFSPTLESTRTLIGGRMVQRGFLGVEPGSKLVTPNPLEAARAGWMAASGIAMATFDALAPRQFIKNLPRFSGPIGITRIAVDAAKRGPADYVFFVAVISLSLGIFNLLPLPPLDGGRVLISLIEGIIRRPVPQQVIIGLTAVGASALGVLMVYLVYSDIGKLILGG